MEESESTDLDVKWFNLIDLSSENDSLIVASLSPMASELNDLRNSENHNKPKSLELSGAMKGDEVVDIVHTSGQTEHLCQLPERSEPEIIRKLGKCNLRKSLTWDSAFFTNAGVLDPEELSSMIEGSKKGGKHLLQGIEEDIHRSTDSISTLKSDNLTLESLEAEFFEDIRASIQKSRKAFNMTKSSTEAASEETVNPQAICSLKKVDLASQSNLKPKPASMKQTIGMPGSGKMIKQSSSNPQVKQFAVRRGDPTSSLPKPIKATSKPSTIPTSTTKRASLGANHAKIENENAESITADSKGIQASKVRGLGGASSAVPKAALSSKSSSLSSSNATKTKPTRSSSSCDSSGSALSDNNGKFPSTSTRRKIADRAVNPPSAGSVLKTPSKSASRSKPASGNSGLSASLLSSELFSSISPASSISEWSSESSSSSTVNQRSDRSRASLDSSSSCRSLDSDAPPDLDLKIHSKDQISDGLEKQVKGLPSQDINKASTQTDTLSQPAPMRPSCLRMPSPKIGFFDGVKSVVCTRNGSMQCSNNGKIGKLQHARTVPATTNKKPDTEKATLPFQEASKASTNVPNASRGENNCSRLSPEGQKEIRGGSCFKAEKLGTEGPYRVEDIPDPVSEVVANENLGFLKNEMKLDMQETTDLKDIKIAPIQKDNCDSSSNCCGENINPSQKAGENAIDGKYHLKNDFHSICKTNKKENGQFEDQVDGLSRNVAAANSLSMACEELFICDQKEEFLINLSDPPFISAFSVNFETIDSRTDFAVKDSFCNTEGLCFSVDSNFQVVETATMPSSEIGQKGTV